MRIVLLICVLIFVNCQVNAINNDSTKTKVTENDVKVLVETMPEFPGGQDSLNRFIAKNVIYPNYAMEEEISGKVYVSFVVNEDGLISSAKVVKGIGGGCDEEALRIVKSMPKWKAGMHCGKKVKVRFIIPISFILI